MKKIAYFGSTLALCILTSSALADKWVNGYMKRDGSYVGGHMKSGPDIYRYNNRSSKSFGGSQRDEFSSGLGATNKGNSSYKWRDNDNDGLSNGFDPKPKSKKNW